ncbi:hypothetical protein SSCG_00564 [Streptomyces clavuligerus]|nr:hypothetical protein SSCG_00564 [Streptomyces clavuligerus]
MTYTYRPSSAEWTQKRFCPVLILVMPGHGVS